MPRRPPLRITMRAREVIAAGEALRPYRGSLADEGVARDEISALRARSEPLVLRVSATGGPASDTIDLVGDWLCDSDGSEPRHLPQPRWEHSSAARSWSRKKTWLGAWERCGNARWLLHAAASVGEDQKQVVAAACACARLALRLVPRGEDRPSQALAVAEAWVAGDSSLRDLSAALDLSIDAADRAPTADEPPALAVNHAVFSAYVAAGMPLGRCIVFRGSTSYIATRAERFARSVAQAVDYTLDCSVATEAEAADLVRSHISTVAVLRAAVESTRET